MCHNNKNPANIMLQKKHHDDEGVMYENDPSWRHKILSFEFYSRETIICFHSEKVPFTTPQSLGIPIIFFSRVIAYRSLLTECIIFLTATDSVKTTSCSIPLVSYIGNKKINIGHNPLPLLVHTSVPYLAIRFINDHTR